MKTRNTIFFSKMSSRFTPLRLPKNDAALLDRIADRDGLTRSEILRRGLRVYAAIVLAEKPRKPPTTPKAPAA
jgi:hypothetical protein